MKRSPPPPASPAAPAPPGASAGELLRAWRTRRGHSQLALALRADVSARHLSFVETGRARPGRETLLRLAARLEIPHRERNHLLLAAGYAPESRERSLDDPALGEVRRAVSLILAALEPSPALAVDRHWSLVAGNRAVGRLLAGLPAALLEPPPNVLRVSLHPDGLAPRIANLAEWRAHVLERLRRDAEVSADPVLTALLEELRALPAPPAHPPAPGGGAAELPVVVPLRLRTEAGVLSFLSTTTVFGSATDVTVSELAIEAFLPADEETAAALRHLAARDGG